MSYEADEHRDEYKREQYERDHPAPDPIECDDCGAPMTMTGSHPGIAQSWAGPGEPSSEEWECFADNHSATPQESIAFYQRFMSAFDDSSVYSEYIAYHSDPDFDEEPVHRNRQEQMIRKTERMIDALPQMIAALENLINIHPPSCKDAWCPATSARTALDKAGIR